jgi:CHAD domain-containing protein
MKPGTTSLAEFAEAQAAERLETLADSLRQAGKQPGHAAPIHDLRVSIRRFKQALRVFKDRWDRGHYRKMRRKLRKLMDLCAAVRNYDIAFEVLEAAGVPAAGDLKTYLRKQRSQAESDLSKQLEGWKAQEILRPWRGWLRLPAGKNKSLSARARQILRPLEQEYSQAGTRAARRSAQRRTNPEELHELRLMAKHLRYSLEIFGAAAGVGWEQKIERMREIQELLGAINDCVTTSGLLAECGHSAEVRRSKAPLKHLLDQRLEAFREHWRKAYGSRKTRRSK